jgi:hypothetical protein
VSRLCHCPLGIVRLVMDVPLHAATPQSTVFLGHCGASFLHLRPTNASPAQWRRLFYSFLGALVPGDAFTVTRGSNIAISYKPRRGSLPLGRALGDDDVPHFYRSRIPRRLR